MSVAHSADLEVAISGSTWRMVSSSADFYVIQIFSRTITVSGTTGWGFTFSVESQVFERPAPVVSVRPSGGDAGSRRYLKRANRVRS